jgi:hypothetical protein
MTANGTAAGRPPGAFIAINVAAIMTRRAPRTENNAFESGRRGRHLKFRKKGSIGLMS